MADGQYGNLKIGAIIQARMRSERLPGKILLPLPYPEGKPLLQWVTEAVKRSSCIDKTVLATSVNPENSVLEVFSKDNDLLHFKGSEEDVLSRFTEIARREKFDHIVRLTGDNPVVDVRLLDLLIDHHISRKNHYTKTSGLPIGMNFEVISSEALLKLSYEKLTDEDREHVTLFIRNSPAFRKEDVRPLPHDFSHIRLTVDYPSDFSALSIIFSLLNNDIPDMTFIQRLYTTHEWIFHINNSNFQRQQFTSEEQEIEAASTFLQKAGFNRAAARLKLKQNG